MIRRNYFTLIMVVVTQITFQMKLVTKTANSSSKTPERNLFFMPTDDTPSEKEQRRIDCNLNSRKSYRINDKG